MVENQPPERPKHEALPLLYWLSPQTVVPTLVIMEDLLVPCSSLTYRKLSAKLKPASFADFFDLVFECQVKA